METAEHALINYYARNKMFRHLQIAAQDSLKKRGNNPTLQFWHAFGAIMEGKTQDGMRELAIVEQHPVVGLCSSLLLLYAHKKSELVDKEAVEELLKRVDKQRKQCGEDALLLASLFLWHLSRHDEARKYVDKMLKMNPDSTEGVVARAWIDFTNPNKDQTTAKKSIKYFDEGLKRSRSASVDALLGKAAYRIKFRHDYDGAMEVLNQVVVSNRGFSPGLIEKMACQFALEDWEQVASTSARVLATEPRNLAALHASVLVQLAHEGAPTEAAESLAELKMVLEKSEPRSDRLMRRFAMAPARVCGRDIAVLRVCLEICERAHAIAPTDPDHLVEMGRLNLWLGEATVALKHFRMAMQLDESSVAALTGVIRAQLELGQLDDAAQQLEFLSEIESSIGATGELHALRAMRMFREGGGVGADDATEHLSTALKLQAEAAKNVPFGPDWCVIADPDLLLTVVDEYLRYSPNDPKGSSEPIAPFLSRALQMLETLVKRMPGHELALFLLARCRVVVGDLTGAVESLTRLLTMNNTFAPGHLLQARVDTHEKQWTVAHNSLEVAISFDFSIRQQALYNLLRARVQRGTSELQAAVATLEQSMAAAGSSTGTPSASASASDRACLYTELAGVYSDMGQHDRAQEIMLKAVHEFNGTPLESRTVIASAELALARGDVDAALATLQVVGMDKSYYAAAKAREADVYLTHMNDKRRYARCYEELMEYSPSTHTCVLLGDALMNIGEADRAISVYESELKKNPRDTVLARKIGEALVKTHAYHKAVTYYTTALGSGGLPQLRYDLAELYLKIGRTQQAETIVNEALSHDTNTDLPTLIEDARLLRLLAQVHEKENPLKGIATLIRARETMLQTLAGVAHEMPDKLQEHKAETGNVCARIAAVYQKLGDVDNATVYYNEALRHDALNEETVLALARHHLELNALDECRRQCLSNDEATMMMADVMYRKGEYEASRVLFAQIIERKPDHYDALVKLIDLNRRAGDLKKCKPIVDAAVAKHESGTRGTLDDAGLCFCRGLYARYTHEANEALLLLNRTRKDREWGTRAVLHMVEICVNPDNETIGGETFESVADADVEGAEKPEAELLAVQTARRLLKELPSGDAKLDTKKTILECQALLVTKSRGNIERALGVLMEIVQRDRDHVGALLGMARAYNLLKQTPKARNQLKRISKMEWTAECAEEFEAAWLLLSDIYIQMAKYDVATELLKRCLAHNQSCVKAHEYLGYIMEKEASYQDAADYYERAWEHGNRASLAVGFRLAFNYLKAKKYVRAVEVALKVLEVNPRYPKIRKEVLDKAIALYRT